MVCLFTSYSYMVVLTAFFVIISSTYYTNICGPGSSVGIATDYGLDGLGIESRWGEIFGLPDRPWGPPSLLYNGYRVFPGGEVRPGRAADHSPLLVPWSWKSRAITLPSLWATTGPVTGTLYLLLYKYFSLT